MLISVNQQNINITVVDGKVHKFTFFFIDVLKNVLKFALNLMETQLTKHKCNGNRLSEQIITHSRDVPSLHRPLQALFVISGWCMTHLNAHRAVIRNSPKAQNCLFPLSSVLSVVIHPLSFFSFDWRSLILSSCCSLFCSGTRLEN